MNMEDMQVSYKGDSVGWGAFGFAQTRRVCCPDAFRRDQRDGRYGRKVYGHTKKELVVSHPGIDRVYLSSGENGTNGVAVVGFGGYRTNRNCGAATTGRRFTRASVSRGDDACERAPEARKFGALMCDFSDAQPGAEAECWTVTTVERTPRARRRTRATETEIVFLVAGPRSERAEVYLNAT